MKIEFQNLLKKQSKITKKNIFTNITKETIQIIELYIQKSDKAPNDVFGAFLFDHLFITS